MLVRDWWRKRQCVVSGRIHRCHRCDPGSIPGWCLLPSFPMWLALLSNFDVTGIRTCAQSSILATRTHHVFAVLDSHQNVVLRNCGSLFISNFSVLRPTVFWVVIRFVPSVALICIWVRLPGSRSEFLLLRRVFVGYLYMFHCEFWRWRELLGILAEIPKSQHALRTKRKELSFSSMEYSWMFLHDMDTLAEWSRRQLAKPMGSPRAPQVSIFFFRCSQACPWGDRKIDSGDWKQCEAVNKAVFSWQSDRDGVSNFDVIISGNPETGQVRRF